MSSFEFLTLPEFKDARGGLVPIEVKDYVTWEPKRVYYAYNNTDNRGGHCHKTECELFVCVRGSITVKLHDGSKWHEKQLKGPKDAVRVDNNIWHEFENFSDDAILLAISSTNYDAGDYVRDFNKFLTLING